VGTQDGVPSTILPHQRPCIYNYWACAVASHVWSPCSSCSAPHLLSQLPLLFRRKATIKPPPAPSPPENIESPQISPLPARVPPPIRSDLRIPCGSPPFRRAAPHRFHPVQSSGRTLGDRRWHPRSCKCQLFSSARTARPDRAVACSLGSISSSSPRLPCFFLFAGKVCFFLLSFFGDLVW
jgi:hypothetical protein